MHNILIVFCAQVVDVSLKLMKTCLKKYDQDN